MVTRYINVPSDCEMVGVGYGGKKSVLARATLVAGNGDIIVDEFCNSKEKVTDYRTVVSGVRPKDMAKAQDFETLREKVVAAMKGILSFSITLLVPYYLGKILVGHGLSNDLKSLKTSHPANDIRDTTNFFRTTTGGKPALSKLAEERLGIKIQTGEHSPVTDARAALRLYLQVRRQWEAKFKKRKPKMRGKKSEEKPSDDTATEE